MITGIYRVLGCSDIIQVPSQKNPGEIVYKRFIRLQEFGGYNRQDTSDRQSNSIIATMMGNLAQCMFYQNELVNVSLRFAIREYQGNWYQDITVADIHKFQ